MTGILNKLNLSNKNILDIGCYDGAFLANLKNGSNNLYGIEASDYGVGASLKRNIKVSQFYIDDKAKFPFRNIFFDLIIAGEIIEHIYDTDFFLDEVYRMLKSGGHFLISTPNIASLGRRILLLLGYNPIIELSPNEEGSSGHIRYFTFNTLKTLLERHGFKIKTRKSDVVNFSGNGAIKSLFLPKFLPALGQSIICLCSK